MSLLLAPYNDSMRLGMGFNSYTQSLCIDNAVTISESNLEKTNNPSQNVTYSSKFVEQLSEVVSSMQISHSSSIKKGTVEIAGNGDSINEDKIKSSDINAVISVKVVNQTIVSGDNAVYQPLPGVHPGTTQFNDNFGDCYISGFITGGEFNGVVSMRVIDRSKTASVVASIKKSSRTGKAADFAFDLDTSSQSALSSQIENDTETTITVSWMGGGQIKDAKTGWTLKSVYAAADAFPARVARSPQRTWAILTKYKANRSFVHQTSELSFSPLEYDLVAAYTSTLFDNYMDYKSMIKSLQDIMEHPDNYEVVTAANALPVHVGTLVAVRTALRVEMNKIVQAVDILTKDPQMLRRSGKLTSVSGVKEIQDIIKQSTSGVDEKDTAAFWEWRQDDKIASVNSPSAREPTVNGTEATKITNGVRDSDKASPASSARPSKTPALVNFDLLISPEIWKSVLPKAKDASHLAPVADGSKIPPGMVVGFPEAPKNDMVFTDQRSGKTVVKLEILSAVCGTLDVTDNLRALAQDESTFVVDTTRIKDMLTTHDAQPSDLTEVFLSFVFRYRGQPERLCVTNMLSIQQSLTITPESTQYPVLKPTEWQPDTWSISAIVYAGKYFGNDTAVNDVLSKLKANYDTGKGQRQVSINSALLKEDPWGKTFKKPSVIFYQSRKGGQIKAAVGIDPDVPCLLTESLTSISDAQVKAAEHSKTDLAGKDAAVSKLQIDLSETKSRLEKVTEDLKTKEAQYQDEVSARQLVEKESTTRETARALAEESVTETKKKLSTKEAEVDALTGQLTAQRNLTSSWVRKTPSQPSNNNLDSSWNGKRVQFTNLAALKGAGSGNGGFAMAVQDGTEQLLNFRCIFYATLKMVDSNDPNAGWWLMRDNGYALSMQSNWVYAMQYNPNDVLQKFYIGLAPDSQFAVRISTISWGNCFFMFRQEENWQLQGHDPNAVQADKPGLYNFHIMAVD